MPSYKWILYDNFLEQLGNGEVESSTATFKIALFASTSNCANRSISDSTFGNLTDELATANGYTAGGVTCAATLALSGGVATFDVADGVFTAAGGSLTARFAVLYNSTTGDSVGFAILQSTAVSVVGVSGTAVSKTSGDNFVGTSGQVLIDGVSYSFSSGTTTALTLGSTGGTQTGVAAVFSTDATAQDGNRLAVSIASTGVYSYRQVR